MLHHGAGYTRLSSFGVFLAGWETKLSNMDTINCFYVARSVSLHLVLLFFFSRTAIREFIVVMVGCFFPANGVYYACLFLDSFTRSADILDGLLCSPMIPGSVHAAP
jgi:hypothetical protein